MIPMLSSSNTDLWRPDIVIINNRPQYYQDTTGELQQGYMVLFVDKGVMIARKYNKITYIIIPCEKFTCYHRT